MKRLLLSLALCCSSLFALTPRVPYYAGFHGPQTVVAGHRSVFYFVPTYSGTFTCATTDVCTGSGLGTYTPTNGDVVWIDSDGATPGLGTLPGGLQPYTSGINPVYGLCNVSGSTWKFERAAGEYGGHTCAGTPIDITSTGSGTHHFYLIGPSSPGSANVYLDTLPTGFPASTTFEVKGSGDRNCPNVLSQSGGKYLNINRGAWCIIATVPSGATPGSYTAHFPFCSSATFPCPDSGGATDFAWPITVEAPPNVTRNSPASVTAIPGRASWEYTMTFRCAMPLSACGGTPSGSGPVNYIDPVSNPDPSQLLPSGGSAALCYYFWCMMFDDIAQYTGNTIYRTAAFRIAMDNLVSYVESTSPPGHMVNYAHFTEPLFRAYRRFGDSTYLTSALHMQNNSWYASGMAPAYDLLRESAYGLMDCTSQKKNANVDGTYCNDLRDALYSMMYRAFESDANVRMPQQGFILGLSAFALIHDWRFSQDNRLPEILKLFADYEWNLYDQVTHTYMNMEAASGTRACVNLPDSNYDWFFPGGSDGNCATHASNYQPLQAMLTPAFWWYYIYSGDTTYRDEGDDMFNHFLDLGSLDNKQSSEVYALTFDSVCWRDLTCGLNSQYAEPVGVAPRRPGNSRKNANSRN